MLRSLTPLLGCGLVMIACMALMGRSGRRRDDPTPPDEDVAALRAEVTRLRAVDTQSPAPIEGAP